MLVNNAEPSVFKAHLKFLDSHMSLPQNSHLGDQATQGKENTNSLVTYWMWKTLEISCYPEGEHRDLERLCDFYGHTESLTSS